MTPAELHTRTVSRNLASLAKCAGKLGGAMEEQGLHPEAKWLVSRKGPVYTVRLRAGFEEDAPVIFEAQGPVRSVRARVVAKTTKLRGRGGDA